MSMQLTEEQIQRFAELERCYHQYFHVAVTPVMEQVRKEISAKQMEEIVEYSKSNAGILSIALSGAGGRSTVQPYEMARLTGEWNSLKAEDYVAMCRERIGKSDAIAADLQVISGEWRTELVKLIGRERYDAMCEEMGTDVAYAYTGYRVERLMIDRLVQQKMPKSSMDYIFASAFDNSLLGLGNQLQRSALECQIAEECEKAYAPSTLEKGIGKTVSFGVDLVTTGGYSSWGSVARLALFEVGMESIQAIGSAQKENAEPSVEQLISQGVFGQEKNILATFREKASAIQTYDNPYMQGINEKMEGRLHLPKEKPFSWDDEMKFPPPFIPALTESEKKEYPNVPLVVLPGMEEAYLAMQKEEKPMEQTPRNPEDQKEEMILIDEQQVVSRQSEPATHTGWGNLLSSIGLSGISDVGKNMGYVLAMLPDVLLGIFTGKTKSLNLKDNLFPIASILIGLFSRNPLLKMLLVGLGGMNLVYKAGKEALQQADSEKSQSNGVERREYKTYKDETLNPRISHPEIQGSYLLATVDRVPCTIRLPDTTVAAYKKGVLPLNTLSNAVLAKNDELRAIAQENYNESQARTTHSRGY
jgi:hypothetical protein